MINLDSNLQSQTIVTYVDDFVAQNGYYSSSLMLFKHLYSGELFTITPSISSEPTSGRPYYALNISSSDLGIPSGQYDVGIYNPTGINDTWDEIFEAFQDLIRAWDPLLIYYPSTEYFPPTLITYDRADVVGEDNPQTTQFTPSSGQGAIGYEQYNTYLG